MYNASKSASKHGTESVGKKQGLDVRSARDYVTPGTATPAECVRNLAHRVMVTEHFPFVYGCVRPAVTPLQNLTGDSPIGFLKRPLRSYVSTKIIRVLVYSHHVLTVG